MEEKIVTLATYSFHHAQVLQNLLASEGIDCFLQNVNLIQGAVNTGVKIRVKVGDLPKAMNILENIEVKTMAQLSEKKIGRPSKPKILLPIDFSDYSEKASEMALDWAIRLQAEIMVLHVYFNPIINTLPFSEAYVYDASLDEMAADMEIQAEIDMKKFIEKFKGQSIKLGGEKVAIKQKLLRGVAEEEIIRYSNEYHPTVIIMGTRGKERKALDLIGSVTAEVIEIARFPVLAVPEDFEYKGIEKIKHVLYATNFDEADFIALDKLEKLVDPLNVKIYFVHVGPNEDSKWDKIKLKSLKSHVEKKFPGAGVECDLIENEDFWVGLEGYIQRKKIDIISLTTRRRNLLARLINPSIGKKMLFHSNTPILVFHA
jgi:nucleotide-binding universal stress UspA family protein